MMAMQQQQQQQPPRGILKAQYAPPPSAPPQVAAGGFRRVATEHTGIVDYTSSRVLKPPGGGSSFTFGDGSEDAAPRYTPPVHGRPAPRTPIMGGGDGRAAGGMAGQLYGWQAVNAEAQLYQPRRDPNVSSISGGIFGGGAWVDEAHARA